jgi:hypothetical protein
MSRLSRARERMRELLDEPRAVPAPLVDGADAGRAGPQLRRLK